MKKVLLFAAIAALATTGCTKETQNSNEAYLKFSMQVTPTKADVNLDANTVVGAYVYNTTDGEALATAGTSNLSYTVQADGSLVGSSVPLTLAKAYGVQAYAPYKATVADVAAVGFVHGDDVLYAPEATIASATAGANTVALKFVHKMSQVKFTVAYGDGATDKETDYPIAGATVSVTGFYDGCTMNLADGTITLGANKDAEITELSKAICFVPNTTEVLSLPVTVTVPHSDGVSASLTFTGGLSKQFVPGESYSYVIKIVDSGLTITGTVVDWVAVDGGDITVN